MAKLTHLDEQGAAHMVDVSGKQPTARTAMAEAMIMLSADAFEAVCDGDAPKGDVLAAARIAGIMAAKKTPELIPLCHSIPLASVAIEFDLLSDKCAIRIEATAKTVAETGVEMEALTAATLAALTIYDMTKAVDKSAVIESIRLLTKSGGKSGAYKAPSPKAPPSPPRKSAPAPAHGRARPSTLMGEVAAPPPRPDTTGKREAFRAFMISHHLRATEWAKDAGVPAAQIYGFLTGSVRAIPPDMVERLARAAKVRVEDMFK